MAGELPWGTVIALLVMIAVPLMTLVLYWIDRSRNSGYISIVGKS